MREQIIDWLLIILLVHAIGTMGYATYQGIWYEKALHECANILYKGEAK